MSHFLYDSQNKIIYIFNSTCNILQHLKSFELLCDRFVSEEIPKRESF